MSARGSRSEVGFAAALQDDLSIFLPGIMPAGEVIERADGSRLSVHFLGEVPPGEVFKTRRGNTIARAGHGRVVLLGGLHELDATCFAEEAAAAGPSIAESLPGAIWSDAQRQLEHLKFSFGPFVKRGPRIRARPHCRCVQSRTHFILVLHAGRVSPTAACGAELAPSLHECLTSSSSRCTYGIGIC